MTFQDQIRTYLDTSGESMRALSLRAGLGAKGVADILHRPGLRPRHATVLALSRAMGLDPVSDGTNARPITYRELINALRAGATNDLATRRAESAISRLVWLLRKAGWVAETKPINRHEVLRFFARNKASTFDLSKGAYATYKSDILRHLRLAPRPKSVADLGGVYGEVQRLIRDSELTRDVKNNSGSLFVFLDARGIAPSEITQDVLLDYHDHRVEVGAKGEETTRKHVKKVAGLLKRLHQHPDFAEFGFSAPGHPYKDGRNKYDVSEGEIAALLADFDARVGPWSRGEISASGQTHKEFIASLDARTEPVVDEKKERARKRDRQTAPKKEGGRHATELQRGGFLLPDDQWSFRTLQSRRGFVAAAAKALLRDRDYLIETLEELTDPEVVEWIAEALTDANEGEFGSGYVGSVLEALLKIAEGLLGRNPGEIKEISAIIEDYDFNPKGLAPRNLAKLQAFTEPKRQAFMDLSGTMLAEINQEVQRRKRMLRRAGNVSPAIHEIYDADLVQQVMVVLAHDILLARAPRSANVTGIDLDWIRWREVLATIVVPAPDVKMRKEGDADLPIPLSAPASALLQTFIEKLRPLVLRPDDQTNGFLFPSQSQRSWRPGRPYKGLLRRLCREVHRIVGVPIHPHLYRHLVGWIWLRDDPSALATVSKILGHKSIQTTARYYAELDEELALDHWHEYLDEKITQPRGRLGGTARASRRRAA